MEIVYDSPSLADLFRARRQPGESFGPFPSTPPSTAFLDDAIEIDVDALYDGETLYIGGRRDGAHRGGPASHSGDSSLHAGRR